MIVVRISVAAATLLVLAGCGGGDSETGAPPASDTSASSESQSASSTPPPTPEPTPSPKPDPLFPKGFPKVVAVSSLPDQVRSWYQMGGGAPNAVAIAPGVWTELPPGASKMDAAMAGIYDGFCASIDAYSRKFRDGEQFAGTCW
jgi:hypothetical protein